MKITPYHKEIAIKIGKFILIAFLLFDLSNSFKQYSVTELDGDIAESVLPYSGVQKIFDDPIGIKTIINNDVHMGTNRFFSHYFLHKTMGKLPLFLQKFYEPIESVYLSCGIVKLLTHIILLFLLTCIVSGKCKIFSLKFLIAAVFLTSFFHANGRILSKESRIIDTTITYTFFYAIPMIFVLLYYIPLFFEFLHNKKIKMNWILSVVWAIFALIACFSSPLNAPIILIANFILFVYIFTKYWKINASQSFGNRCLHTLKAIPQKIYLFIVPIGFVALYSLFLGTYNNAFASMQLPLKELYAILPQGVWNSFFASISYSIIIVLLVVNYLIIKSKHKNTEQAKKIFSLYQFLIVFAIVYVLFVPFGGFRSYRPLILRFDTILPITIFSIITIASGFLFILKMFLSENKILYPKILYPLLFGGVVIFFTLRDNYEIHNECEKNALYIIAQSQEAVVKIGSDCTVMSWGLLHNPQSSKPYAELLYLWNVTDRVKLYYNLQE